MAFSETNVFDPTGTYSRFTFFGIELVGPHFLSGDALILTPPPLVALAPFGPEPLLGYGTDVYLYASTPSDYASFRVELTSLTRVELTPPLPVDLPGGIPEPSIPGLVALGVSALLARRFA